jgi:hypothetical protein
MEDELGVALKGEWPIDIVDTALISGKIKYAGLVSESK